MITRRNLLQTVAATAATTVAGKRLLAGESAAPWRMRLATSSVMFADLPIEQVCLTVSRLGLEGVDIWSPFDRCTHLDDVEQRLGAEGLAELLLKHKLALAAFSVYRQGFIRYAKFIRRFGGGIAVRGSQSGQVAAGDLVPAMKAFFEKLKPEIDLAAECKARLAIENHGAALVNTIDSFKAFIDLNPAPDHVGIALAPYHLQAIKASIEQAIAISGAQLLFFYAWQNASGMAQLPGHGATDFAPWLDALAKINYPHHITIFMHGHPPAQEMEAAVARSRRWLLERR